MRRDIEKMKKTNRYWNIVSKNDNSGISTIPVQPAGMSKDLRLGTKFLKLWILNEHYLAMRRDIEKMKKTTPDIEI